MYMDCRASGPSLGLKSAVGAGRLLVFSLVPRSHGEWGWAKYTSTSVARPNVWWAAISAPWSQVLIREYLPKGTEITSDASYLDSIANELNGRPRRVLNFMTPAEKFAELLSTEIASTG